MSSSCGLPNAYSWSELIDDVEWGYNRDGDNLAQINLCLLMGIESRLPVQMTVYNGSIRDVSTLETTVSQMAPDTYNKCILVMDKGFSSKKNINALLKKQVQFILALPLTLTFTKNQIESERKDINQFSKTIVTGSETLRGITKTRSWNTNYNLHVHVYYNDVRATEHKNQLYGRVQQLMEEAQKDPHNGKLKEQFNRYLIIRKSEKTDGGYTINVREDVLREELAYSGWLVLVSNEIKNTSEAIRIYRDKDVVEKGFHRIKNSLGLNRLLVHSQKAMENKVFIGFIALIMSSHIHRVMLEEKIYKKMTMKELIRTMEKLRTLVIKNKKILFPVTKEQKEIYHAFNVQYPM